MKTYHEIFEVALKKYGGEKQTIKLFEEMAELQDAICKSVTRRGTVDHIAEEIADVEIMLEQMKILHNCEDAVERYRHEKIDRLQRRIEGERDGRSGGI